MPIGFSRIAGAVAAAGSLAALAFASAAPLTVHGGSDAVLRLAFSVRPERIETCRSLSSEELAKVPQHMRQPVVCEGRAAEYDLTVRRNGAVLLAERVHGAGLRRDRRLYVFKEFQLEPGEALIEIAFDRVGDGGSTTSLPGSDVAPPHLGFSERIRVRPREVVLITYATARGALVTVRQPDAMR